MRRRRLSLLAVLAVTVVLAGCSAGFGGGPAPTPTTADCTPYEQPVVEPFRESVEPSDYPDPPDRWTHASVEQYITEYERAYARNDALSRESTRVTVSVSDVVVRRAGGDWVIELTSRTFTWAAGTAVGSATATEIHGDGPTVQVVYRLTDSGLYRAEGTTDLSARGTPVACTDR